MESITDRYTYQVSVCLKDDIRTYASCPCFRKYPIHPLYLLPKETPVGYVVRRLSSVLGKAWQFVAVAEVVEAGGFEVVVG